MTASLIAPVIPSARPAHRGRGMPGQMRAVSPLPLVSSPDTPPTQRDVVYGIGRIDAYGRVADRTITYALGWRSGVRLTLTADAGVVVVRRNPGAWSHCRPGRTS